MPIVLVEQVRALLLLFLAQRRTLLFQWELYPWLGVTDLIENDAMPLLMTGGRGRWDRTPKSHVWTTRHLVKSAPPLDDARRVQDRAYDWALGELANTPSLKVVARGDSLWKRLTMARSDGTLERAALALQRAATAQAHEAFALRNAHLSEKASLALAEQEEATTPRTVRQLSKTPKPTACYLRSHPSKQAHRRAVSVLEGVRVIDASGTRVRVQGVGIVHVRDPVIAPVSSAQIVERRGALWLHVQHGDRWPEPKPAGGKGIGLDAGITHTLTCDDGAHWQRPDTSGLEDEARRVDRHRAKCCPRGSRQWNKQRRKASRLRAKAHRIHENWERHTAKDISQANDDVGIEDLRIRNMTASARGTSSMHGSRAKQGLNRSLARARLGRLHIAVHRRALRDGTWCVAVDPRNTSITCSQCGHKDRESRKGARFKCTKWGFQIHADQNAGINLKRRARNVLAGFVKAQGGGERRRGGEVPGRQGFGASAGKAATLHPEARPGFAGSQDPAHGLEMTGGD